MQNLTIIKAKDISKLTGCSIRTAQRYYNDIKKEYDLNKAVTYSHLCKYLQI